MSRIGFGITGDLDPQVVRELAPAVERAGLDTLWVNQPGRAGDALGVVAIAAEVTRTLRLATGVLPMELFPADGVVDRVRELTLPTDRLVLGIGASRRPSPLTTAREAVRRIHDGLDVPVVVGALGPRMRRLGTVEADGVLLNWLTPELARDAAEDRDRDRRAAQEQTGGTGDADGAGTSARAGETALYVRCAIGAAAHEVTRREAEKYASIPTYAANFARHGYGPLTTAVLAEDGASLREGLAGFDGTVEEVVVRAVTATGSLAEHLELVEALAGD